VELPAVDLVLSATAPLSPQLAAEAERKLQARLIEIYGCTEAGQVAARRTTAGEVWTALGELRCGASTAPSGERFLVAGGHVLEPTPLADILELLDERRFRLLGRANDLIHVAGKRSSLAHLNFHLNRIDGVEDGAFWLPDEVADGVVRPVAFVVAPGLTARARSSRPARTAGSGLRAAPRGAAGRAAARSHRQDHRRHAACAALRSTCRKAHLDDTRSMRFDRRRPPRLRRPLSPASPSCPAWCCCRW
jgi:hypothetical protein